MAKRIGAGYRYIYYGVVNSDGYLIGNSLAGATAGDQTGEGMTRLEGAVTQPLAPGENENLPIPGDDETLTTFDFESATLPAGVIEMAVRDSNFEAIAQGTLVESVGSIEIGSLQPSANAFTDLAFLFQRRSKKWAAGVKGVKAWEILNAPRSTCSPLFTEYQTRAHNPYRYGVTTSKSDRKSWGDTFTDAVNGTLSAPLVVVDSDNPMHIHAHKGNNSQQAFDLQYTPVSGARSYVFINGVQQALTTDFTLAGNTITFVGTPADGAIINTFYEVDESNLS